MDFGNLPVPISVQTVGHFIDNQTGALEHTLQIVRDTVEWAVRGENVVKIYGRDDRQSGDKFKDVRKIAGKFNSYHRSKKKFPWKLVGNTRHYWIYSRCLLPLRCRTCIKNY